MTSYFDKLNLKPAERRLVVFVALTVFIVLNAFFVWPKFFDWSKVKQRRVRAERSLDQFQREVQRIPQYEARLRELEKQGASVGSEDQALRLSTTVQSQAALSGVQINVYTPQPRTSSGGKTNLFFDEQTAVIQFVAEEKNLIDFLYNLGVGGSMIRVRQMTLNPDPPRNRLQGSITLVASYARRAPAGRAATAPAAAAAVPASPRSSSAAATPGRSLTNALRGAAAATNSTPPKASWLSRLWPFGKKTAEPTTSPARTNAPSATNAPPNR